MLVLARPMHAGEPLDAAALRAEPVHVGATVGHVPAADLHRMVGKVAAADLAQGTLVSDSLFIGRPPVPAGSTVVAAALAPGQFATFQLRPGQAVAAIRTGGQPAATGATAENAGDRAGPGDGLRDPHVERHDRHVDRVAARSGGVGPGRRIGGGGEGPVPGARGERGVMSIVAIGSLRGSPGATTMAVALASVWDRPRAGAPLVVEADPDGGVLAARSSGSATTPA